MPCSTCAILRGDLQAGLDRLAAEIGKRDHEAGDEDADRVEPAEEGDDDRGEAVAGRDHRLQLSDDARHLHDAGEAGKAARKREGEDRHALGGKSGEGAGARAFAQHADLEALQRAREDDGERQHDDERDDGGGVEPPAADEGDQRGIRRSETVFGNPNAIGSRQGPRTIQSRKSVAT